MRIRTLSWLNLKQLLQLVSILKLLIFIIAQTDRGRLDYATDSLSAYTSIDDGEQRYETEEGTVNK